MLYVLLSLFFLNPALAVWYGEPAVGAQWSSVVYLKNQSDRRCSGVIVSQNTVLTAGHCVQWFLEDLSRSNLEIHSTDIENPTRQIGFNLKIKEIKTHPSYTSIPESTDDVNKDLGYIKYNENILSYFKQTKPVAIVQGLADTKGSLTAVGFGARSYVSTRFSRYSEKISRTKADVNLFSLSNYISVVVKNPKSEIYTGDSGGGLFSHTPRGTVLIGIQSGVSEQNTNKVAHFVLLTNHLDWIQKIINE
ncbi:MAG: trypsin-like serine protease [Oligoflexia bacterium]|nr:trypsin-like serine protease [Oligoflexia bacterium]